MGAPGGAAANQVGLEAVFQTTEYQKGLQTYLSGLQKANAATDATAKSVGGFGTAISVALGNAIYNVGAKALNFLVDGLTSVIRGAIGATGELQNLTIMLETLAAKELVSSGGAFSMADALDKSRERAQAMLAALRDLSVASPFQYKDVIQVYRLNLAFGQGSDMAMKLTKSILDMAAGMGLSGPFLERIAYNFSQMSLVGKITMRDVRDLAMAGVDLAAMLRDQLGKSIEEVNAGLAAGSITMRDVSQAFVDYADKNFGGAAQRMSRTLQGLQSSFQDLFFFASVDVFGPAAEVVTGALGNIFDKANAIVKSGALKVIGASLEVLARQFFQSGDDITTAVTDTADDTVARWQQWALDAATYGSNIIVSFANGIIGGATAVLNALVYIGNIISSWLSPGSPPRLLPDLPKWGSAAMTEFLEGMGAADFDVLKGIQGPLESALRLMIQTGKIGAGAAGELLADLSSQMAEALAGGGALGGGFFDAMMAATGPFGDELADLVELSMELAAATEGLTSAEEELAAATAATEAAEQSLEDARDRAKDTRADLNKAKMEYNRLVREGASEADLAAALARVNLADAEVTAAEDAAAAAEGGLETAQDAEDAAQEHLDTIQAQVDAMQELVDLQEQLLQQLLELTQAQIVMPEAAAGAGGAGAPAGGAGGIPPMTLPPFEVPELDLSGFSTKMSTIFKDMKKELDLLEIKFMTVWFRLFGPERGIITTMAKAALGPAYDAIAKLVDGIDWPKLTGYVAGLAIAVTALAAAWALLTAPITLVVAGLGLIALGIDALANPEKYAELTAAFEKPFDDINAYIETWKANLSQAWADFMSAWNLELQADMAVLVQAFMDAFASVNTQMDTWKSDFKLAWGTFWLSVHTVLVTKWEEMKTAVATAVADIKTAIDTKVAEIKTNWDTFWAGVKATVDDLMGAAQTKVETTASAISTAISGMITWLNTLITKIKAAIAEWKKLISFGDAPEAEGTGGQSFAGGGVVTTPSRVVTPRFPVASHPITTTTYNKTVNMGGITVNSAIEMAALKVWLRQAIREEMA